MALLVVMGVSGSGNNKAVMVNLGTPALLELEQPEAQVSIPVEQGFWELKFKNSWSAKLGWKFYDADDYHPKENRKKMAEGIPLNDQDRIPWLCCLHDILRREYESGQKAVLACSALKKMYRHILQIGKSGCRSAIHQQEEEGSAALKILFVHLDGSPDLIAKRLERRAGHFMPAALLQSQFDTLEPPSAPEHFLTINLEKPISEIVAEIEEYIRKGY